MPTTNTPQTQIAYAKESKWGKTPSGDAKRLRFTGESLYPEGKTIPSKEISSSRNPNLISISTDSIWNIDCEFSADTLDDFIQGALCSSKDFTSTEGDNAAMLNLTGQTVTTSTTPTDRGLYKFTFPLEVSLTEWDKIIEGMSIRIKGFTGVGENLNGIYRVVRKNPSAQWIEVAQQLSGPGGIVPVAVTTGNTSISVLGGASTNGTTMQSFTFMKRFGTGASKDDFSIVNGLVVKHWSMTVEEESILSGSLSFIGKKVRNAVGDSFTSLEVSATDTTTVPSFSIVADANPTETLNVEMLEGYVYEECTETSSQHISMSFNLDNQSQKRPAIGNGGIRRGTIACTGTIKAYFQDMTLYDKFKQNSDMSFYFRVGLERLNSSATAASYAFNFPRIKMSDSTEVVDCGDGFIVDGDWETLQSKHSDVVLIASKIPI